jgi:predicted alpha/beta superfamily hydrolase
MRFRLQLIPAVVAILNSVPSFAQTEASTPAFLADVTSFVMKASSTGRRYQVSVALPAGYSKQHVPYPVLYAADANAEFGTLVEGARTFAEIPGLVIVGIGYPDSGQGFAWVPRALDLTTTPDPKAPGTNGGAADFLRFIRTDLVPYMERTYNVGQDRAWFGHSFGGLFGIYALFNNEGLFRRFIIGSPSLWQGGKTIRAAEQSFAATGKPLPARVFFSVGLLEPGGMVGDLRAFIGNLERRHYNGLEYQVHYFDDETHLSVIPVTIGRGLRYIYAPQSSQSPRK